MKEILLVSLAGGVCALDTTAAWQIMLSQPLVSGTIAGFLLGNTEAGAAIGLVLQLLWSAAVPVGARPMPDSPVGTVSGVWLAVGLLRAGTSASFAYLAGLLAALLVALAGRQTILLERELNGRLFRRLRIRLDAGRSVNPDSLQFLSATVAFGRGFLLTFLAAALLVYAARHLAALQNVNDHGCDQVLVFIKALGLGVLFHAFVSGARMRFVAFACGIAFAFLIRSL